MTRGVLTLSLIVLLAGCASVGPDYKKPETPLTGQWNTKLNGGLKAAPVDPAETAKWWTTFDDPILSTFMERAVRGNLDLKKAKAAVRAARARRKIAVAGQFPTVTASGSYAHSRSSVASGGGGVESGLYSADLDASWELDLFGSLRRSVEAATGDLEASREDLNNTLVSLMAELGLNYVDARTYQERVAVAESNLKAQEETYKLVCSKARAGLTTELAVQQARYNMENTRSLIPTLRTGYEGAVNRIAVLLGEQPGAVHDIMHEPRPVPFTPVEIAVGIPADVLRRRPDIRKAERELAAQTARVGVATAELYPKLTLNGTVGLNALSSARFLTGDATAFSFGPNLSIPIFNAGSIRAGIEVQSALQEQSLAAYESSILSAVEEVENALVAYAEEQNRRKALVETTDAAQLAVDLAKKQYQSGLTDFNNVLDAQRSLLSFQDSLTQSNGTVTSNLIRLYKRLGGGWTPFPPEAGAQNRAER